mmetsp:Transcript_73893/g.119927  ORF Transcript_73893/g.119927 Transcript_73893/m.119927 type:complete len:960 (+) Transcript_73893:95-2974(+)|eukprot:CAMPEP_0179447604 /NCGR_PEP_ID=MMETSP0799-20121207/31419_1 /TAXON_ID=46947 /ORGANISM="Geminigera cryophila, Strain CCMP2564" /LENGTH=959 /DNA_ID=CAMNT_0021238551 /DNA_START=94 /DNA_END=2973 /DNA_ORIENTATION=+
MSQFRSEDMALVQLFIQSEAAHDTLHALGQIGDQEGCIQFKDLNAEKSAFQRLFVTDVRRCDDMLRILRLLKETVAKEKHVQGRGAERAELSLHELHDKLLDLEKEMKEHGGAYLQLKKQNNELEEHDWVLMRGDGWFANAYKSGVSMVAPSRDGDGGTEMADMEGGMGHRSQHMLGHIAGCVPYENFADMELTLFRATRGNMLLKKKDIDNGDGFYDPVKDEFVKKCVFVVFFSGERSRVKIDKICDSFGATKHMLPEDQEERAKLKSQINEKKEDLKKVLDVTQEFKLRKLGSVKDSVEDWYEYVIKEKCIFVTLNMFNYDVTHKCLIAEGWCPEADMEEIKRALREGTSVSRASVQSVLHRVQTKETPPTYFRNEPVAQGTQSIVDAYGMARYKEFNPAVFSVTTFPFLFGVMFGDVGHGFMMAMCGFLLVRYEEKLKYLANDEMFGTVYKGRYNILMMGIFATYAGFIYNELFAVPMEVFGNTVWCSGESPDVNCQMLGTVAHGDNAGNQLQKWLRTNIDDAYDFKKQQSSGVEVSWEVYPLGSDPGWAHTANKLNFGNSFKMKFAIIVGVIQMVAGVCTKCANCLFFQDWVTLYWVYIPEMVFINSIFGYLCLLILTKWTTNWDATYVLNNNEIVSIPQVYCKYEPKERQITNLPCWTAPFEYSKDAASKLYGGLLDTTEGWCMKGNVATAGCAVYELNGKLIVEQNTFGNTTMPSPDLFNPTTCADGVGCMMYKQSPPSLLDTLIKMFMEIGSVPVEASTITSQGTIQVCLILLAFFAVPCMLFPKPYILKWEHEKTKSHHHSADSDDDEAAEELVGGGHDHGHGEFDFGEEMVHQMIHTIEYVLGCISNTASYLRLWALSLAHAQLSEVFWEKTVVEIGLESSSAVMLFVCISAWACFTVAVLMGMESLSAFLHALRLHWVEFMNKFYFGDGYKFSPFGFSNVDQVLGETSD